MRAAGERARVGRWPEMMSKVKVAQKVGQQLVFTQADGTVVSGEFKYRGVLKEDASGQVWLGIEVCTRARARVSILQSRPTSSSDDRPRASQLASAVGRHSGRGYFRCAKSRGLFVREATFSVGSGPPPVDDGSCPEPFSIVMCAAI